MPIPKLPAAVRGYLGQFAELRAVCIGSDGNVYVSCDPVGAGLAWWCRKADAQRLARSLKRSGSHDAPAAARKLRIGICTHDGMMQRAEGAITQVERALREAGDRKLLRYFNIEYARRRKAARAAGIRFPSYCAVRARLRKAVVGAIATRGIVGTSLVDQAFKI